MNFRLFGKKLIDFFTYEPAPPHLYKTDLAVIAELEALLKIRLDFSFSTSGNLLNESNRVTRLALQDAGITDLRPLMPFLTQLKYLIELSLDDNDIVNLEPLAELGNLKVLRVAFNKIHNIGPLQAIPDLTSLDISNNPVSEIQPLEKIVVLTADSCQLNDISWIGNFKDLKILSLRRNKIRSIAGIEKLKLKMLSLGENQLSDLSPLQNMQSLEMLDLRFNNIIDITPLKNLLTIETLILTDNPIQELPEWITDFDQKIKWIELGATTFARIGIFLFNTIMISPPGEIIRQGKEKIRNYFKQMDEQDEDFLFEAKLLILGEPGAGKTTLARKIKHSAAPLPDEKETTKGIDVHQYHFPIFSEDFPQFQFPEKIQNRKFYLNLWDFGGQEIYKATHRFFLNERSLYALVADSRNEDTDFNYWLHIEEIFGGESPLIIVLNEKYSRKRNIGVSEIRKRFLNVREIASVDFADKDYQQLEMLKKSIRYYVSRLPHIGSKIPAKWTIVRSVLVNDLRNTITLQDYLAICDQAGIAQPEDALVLSQYFHDIGVFLHFQDDELLNKTIFLNPTWTTTAVYKILDHEILNVSNGRFTKEDSNAIWVEKEYMFVRNELLRLMQRFFLAYQIGTSGEYIVPERLQNEQPVYPWQEHDNLMLRYEYDIFMPKGILSQFIVQMHRFIKDHGKVWRRGVILQREGAVAEVIETYDARAIKVRVLGNGRRDFLTIIGDQIDAINAQYKKLDVEKMIPCNCETCRRSTSSHFYTYKDLKRRLDNNRANVECSKSFTYVNVQGLIDEVITPLRPNLVKTKIFISYAHTDTEMLKRIQTYLYQLNLEGLKLHLWDDTQIKAGEDWQKKIEYALAESKAAILLVSADFLASDFINTEELPALFQAAENGGTTILPLILNPCRFSENKRLSVFQAVNNPAQPLSGLNKHQQDQVFLKLTNRISELLDTKIPDSIKSELKI